MQIVNLNMISYGLAPIVHASRYDVGREFRFDLFNADVEYIIPKGTWVIIHGLKPSSHTFAYSNRDEKDPTIVRYDGCSIYLKTTEEMTSATGNTKCEFILRQPDGTIISSLNWTLQVETGALPNDIMATTAELIAYQRMMQSISYSYEHLKYEMDNVPEKLEKVPVTEKQTVALVWYFTKLMEKLQHEIDEFNATFNHITCTTLKASEWKVADDLPSAKQFKEDDEALSLYYDLGPEYENRVTYIELDTMEMTEELAEQMDEFVSIGSIGSKAYMLRYDMPKVDIPVIIGYVEMRGRGLGSYNAWSTLWRDFQDDTLPDEEEDDDDAGDIPGDDRCCCCDVRQV